MLWTSAFAGVREGVTSARLAFPALLAGAALLAIGPWLVRLTDVGPSAAAFWRLFLAVPVLWLIARLTSQSFGRPRKRALLAIAAGAAFFATDLAFWHASIGLTKLANATLFGNASTFAFAAYGFWAARAWPGPAQWAALLLAALGAALLMGGSLQLSPRSFRGDLLALTAGLLYTGYLVAIDRLRGSWAPLPLLTLASLFGAPLLLAFALVGGERILTENWTPLVLLALSSQVLGQGLLVFAIGHVAPVVVGLVLLTQPLVAGAIGWIVYGERFTWGDWTGAALLGVALVLVRLREPAKADA